MPQPSIPHRLLLSAVAVVLACSPAVVAQAGPERPFTPSEPLSMPALSKGARQAIAEVARQADLVVLAEPWVRLGDWTSGWVNCVPLAVYKGDLSAEHDLFWLPQATLPSINTRRGSCGQLLALVRDPQAPGGWKRLDLPRTLPAVPETPGGWLSEFERAVQTPSQPPAKPAFVPAAPPATMPLYTPPPPGPTVQMAAWINDLDHPGPRQQAAMIGLAQLGDQALLGLLKAAQSDRWERSRKAKMLLALLDGGQAWQGLRLRLSGPTQRSIRVLDQFTFQIDLVNLTDQPIRVDGSRPGAFLLRNYDPAPAMVPPSPRPIPDRPADWLVGPYASLAVQVDVRVTHHAANGDQLSLVTPVGAPRIGRSRSVSVEAWFQDTGPEPAGMGAGELIGPRAPGSSQAETVQRWPGGRLRSNTVELRLE